MTHINSMFYLRSVSIAFENLKHGFVNANSNASLSNVNLFNVFAFVSIRSDGPIDVSFSLKNVIKYINQLMSVTSSPTYFTHITAVEFDTLRSRPTGQWFPEL